MQQCEVQPGETLISISIRENVSIPALRRINKLYGNEIFPGQVLSLRSTPKAVEVPDNSPGKIITSSEKKHSVVRSASFSAPSAPISPIAHGKRDGKPPTNRPHSQSQPQPMVSDENSIANSAAFVGNTLLEAMTDTKAAMMLSADAKMASMRSFVSSLTIPIKENTKENDFGRVRASSSNSVATLSVSFSDKKSYNQMDVDKFPPTLIGNRNILTVHQAKQLRAFLPSMQQIENWKLLYSVLNNGADLDTFFRRSAGHKYTIIIAKTMNGEIFGGFNSVEWTTSPNFFGSGEGFIFKFDSEDNIKQYPWTGENDFFVFCSNSEIAMGGGGNGFGFVLDSDFATGESFRSATYGNPILVDKENGAFKVANVECWGFEGLFGRASNSTQSNKLSSHVAY